MDFCFGYNNAAKISGGLEVQPDRDNLLNLDYIPIQPSIKKKINKLIFDILSKFHFLLLHTAICYITYL